MLCSSGGGKIILPFKNWDGFYYNKAFVKYNTIQPVNLKEYFFF